METKQRVHGEMASAASHQLLLPALKAALKDTEQKQHGLCWSCRGCKTPNPAPSPKNLGIVVPVATTHQAWQRKTH